MIGAQTRVSYPSGLMGVLRYNANYILSDPQRRSDAKLSNVKKVPKNGEGYRLDRVLCDIEGFEAKFREIQSDYQDKGIGRKQQSYKDLQDIIREEGIFCGPMFLTDGIKPSMLASYNLGNPSDKFRVVVYHPELSEAERYFQIASFLGTYFLDQDITIIEFKKTIEANLFALNCAIPIIELLKIHKEYPQKCGKHDSPGEAKMLRKKLEKRLGAEKDSFTSLEPALRDVARLIGRLQFPVERMSDKKAA